MSGMCYWIIAPIARSNGGSVGEIKKHVFHATGLHAWPRQPGFPHDRRSSSSISNTSIYPSEFYKDCKSHISVEFKNRNHNPSVCKLILLNSQTSRTATCTSHFTNTRSCIVPTASPQTEKFQYLNPYVKPSRNHDIHNSTLLNSQTLQTTGLTHYFFSIITSSIISHPNVRSQDLNPCNSFEITNLPRQPQKSGRFISNTPNLSSQNSSHLPAKIWPLIPLISLSRNNQNVLSSKPQTHLSPLPALSLEQTRAQTAVRGVQMVVGNSVVWQRSVHPELETLCRYCTYRASGSSSSRVFRTHEWRSCCDLCH